MGEEAAGRFPHPLGLLTIYILVFILKFEMDPTNALRLVTNL
jgi:hypothetical protein